MLERDYSLDSKQIKMNTSKNMNDSMDSLNTINIPNPLLDISTEKKEDQKAKTYEMLIKGVDIKSYLADFRDKDDSKHSESYIDLKTALSECADVVRDINAGKFTWTSENYNSFNRLYEAVSRYVNDHMDARSKDGKKRLDSAINLKLVLYNMSSEILWQEGVKTDIEKPRYDSKELDAARDNVKRLIKYYRAYCTRIGTKLFLQMKRNSDVNGTSLRAVSRIFAFILIPSLEKSFQPRQHISRQNIIHLGIRCF